MVSIVPSLPHIVQWVGLVTRFTTYIELSANIGDNVSSVHMQIKQHENLSMPPLLLRSLMAAAAESDAKLQPLLSRAWTLGPKRLGPNILLSNASVRCGSAAGPGFSLPPAGSLWDVSRQHVVPVVKRPVTSAALAGIPIADDKVDKACSCVDLSPVLC